MGRRRGGYRVLVRKPQGKRQGQGQVAGCFEHDDEHSGSIKCGEFLD
jgi:hypothetical protein